MALCLNTAHGAGMSSIAIPAIGTGNLSYPRDKVASTMYEEVKKFSTKNSGTSLKDIRFLVYDHSTVAVSDCKLMINLKYNTFGHLHKLLIYWDQYKHILFCKLSL